MNDRTVYATSVLWFLAGGIAGATAALLLAPQSGTATREAMTRKIGETTASARDMKDRALQKGAEVWGEASNRVSDAASALTGGDGRRPSKREEESSSV